MCLILFAYDCHPRYRLIIAANRDEFYRRPSLPVAYWEDYPQVLAGRDREAGGTWLGITKQGRFAALTNYRRPAPPDPQALSRGQLVKGFLGGSQLPLEYLTQIQKERQHYNPFNILLGDQHKLYYYSSLKNRLAEVEPGIHGLSNAFLDTPWPKVLKGKKALAAEINNQEINPQELLEILTDQEIYEDHRLPTTGVSMEWERLLSSIYIASQDYGTRASSVLLIDRQNHVTFVERSLPADGKKKLTTCYELELSD